MDANRWSRYVVIALVALGGCATTPRAPYPVPAHPAAASQPSEPPQVVNNGPASETGDAVTQAILDYIKRLDTAHLPPRTGANVPSAMLAADTEPPTETQPAPIEIEPEVQESQPVTHGEPPATSRPAEPAPVTPPPPAPPRVSSVSVTGSRAPAPRESEDDAPAGINAPAFARSSATLRDYLDQNPLGAQPSFREQLDRRMLWVVAGEYEHARQPLELVTAEQQELASRFVAAWIVVRDCHMGDQAAGASAALHELEQLETALRRLSDLSLSDVRICSAVRGFGQYDALEPAQFPAGAASEFVLYCEVHHFVSKEQDGAYESKFAMTTTLLNRAGETLLELKDADLVDRCRTRRHDCFIPRLVRLPATLAPGQYTAKVTVTDQLAQKLAESRATFQIAAR
jgi:hypothetical protein